MGMDTCIMETNKNYAVRTCINALIDALHADHHGAVNIFIYMKKHEKYLKKQKKTRIY